MGKQDDYQSAYLDDDRRFADQINGALFGERQVVKPEELEREDTQAVNLEEKGRGEKTARTIVDKSRLWRGRKLHVLVIENQNYVDYHMVLRNMLSESNEYNRQRKEKKRVHEEAHDLKSKDAYLSRMKPEEKFTPVITLAVYFGTEHPWDGAKCQALVQTCKELGASRETIMEKCMEKFELTREKAKAYVEEYYPG